jgi:tetratricopeptide (TPR) repeat protein
MTSNLNIIKQKIINENYQEALDIITSYDFSLLSSIDKAKYYYYLGEIYYNLMQDKKAFNSLLNALNIEIDFIEKGNVFILLGNLELIEIEKNKSDTNFNNKLINAKKYYNRAFQYDLTDEYYCEVYLGLGRINFFEKNYHLAIDNYSKALEFSKKNIDMRYDIIIYMNDCYCALEQYETAIGNLLNLLIKLNDKDKIGICYFQIAQFYKEINKLKEAITYYLKTISIFSSSDIQEDNDIVELSYWGIGESYKNLNLLNDALYNYKKALLISKSQKINSNEYLYDIGIIFRLQKQYSKAEKIELLALKKSDNDINRQLIYNELSIIYAEQEKFEKSINILNKLITEYPKYNDIGNVLSYKGRLYMKMGRYDEAIKWLKKATRKFIQINDIEELIFTKAQIARSYLNQNKIMIAEDMCNELINEYSANKFLTIVYAVEAEIYLRKGMVINAINKLNKVLNNEDLRKNTKQYAEWLMNIANKELGIDK